MVIGKRIEYIDLLKSFGIILMVIGHIYEKNHASYNAYLYIYSFHMPLFFFISGFLYKECNIKDFVERKFKTLIVPYLFFGVLNGLITWILYDSFHIRRYFEHFIFYNHKTLGVGCAIWFLTALFFVNVIYILLEKLCNRFKRGEILLPIIIFILGISEAYLKVRLPYSMSSSLSVLPIFYLGTIFRRYKEKIQIQGWLVPLLFITLPVISIFYNGRISTRGNSYNNYFLFLINSIITILGYWFIFEQIKLTKYFNYVKYIGVNSLYYVCLNQAVIYVFVDKLNITNTVLVFLMTMPILYICSEILIRIKKKLYR